MKLISLLCLLVSFLQVYGTDLGVKPVDACIVNNTECGYIIDGSESPAANPYDLISGTTIITTYISALNNATFLFIRLPCSVLIYGATNNIQGYFRLKITENVTNPDALQNIPVLFYFECSEEIVVESESQAENIIDSDRYAYIYTCNFGYHTRFVTEIVTPYGINTLCKYCECIWYGNNITHGYPYNVTQGYPYNVTHDMIGVIPDILNCVQISESNINTLKINNDVRVEYIGLECGCFNEPGLISINDNGLCGCDKVVCPSQNSTMLYTTTSEPPTKILTTSTVTQTELCNNTDNYITVLDTHCNFCKCNPLTGIYYECEDPTFTNNIYTIDDIVIECDLIIPDNTAPVCNLEKDNGCGCSAYQCSNTSCDDMTYTVNDIEYDCICPYISYPNSRHKCHKSSLSIVSSNKPIHTLTNSTVSSTNEAIIIHFDIYLTNTLFNYELQQNIIELASIAATNDIILVNTGIDVISAYVNFERRCEYDPTNALYVYITPNIFEETPICSHDILICQNGYTHVTGTAKIYFDTSIVSSQNIIEILSDIPVSFYNDFNNQINQYCILNSTKCACGDVYLNEAIIVITDSGPNGCQISVSNNGLNNDKTTCQFTNNLSAAKNNFNYIGIFTILFLTITVFS